MFIMHGLVQLLVVAVVPRNPHWHITTLNTVCYQSWYRFSVQLIYCSIMYIFLQQSLLRDILGIPSSGAQHAVQKMTQNHIEEQMAHCSCLFCVVLES